VLNLVKETLDKIALTIEREIAFALTLAIGLGRGMTGVTPWSVSLSMSVSVSRLPSQGSPGHPIFREHDPPSDRMAEPPRASIIGVRFSSVGNARTQPNAMGASRWFENDGKKAFKTS
jgi:hypothetical protein